MSNVLLSSTFQLFCLVYSALYEKDHFNQAQAEFKKEAKGQSKHTAQKKRGKKGEKKGRDRK